MTRRRTTVSKVQEGALRAGSRGDPPAANKYSKLPEPVRREDMITSHDARPQPSEKGEHDRETEFMLRTTGLFI